MKSRTTLSALIAASFMLASVTGCASDVQVRAEAAPTAQNALAEAWLDKTAVEQAEAIANGELTSAQLVNGYLARIAQLDGKIHSVLALNPEALAQAKARDEAVARGDVLGPLHGIPVLLKDNIETRELPTTAGAMALLHNDTQRDAPLVARLRAAGAVILGKTNLSEWANFRSEDSISGWSAVGGLTRNPHDLSRSACGSSSGSGAAMAAHLASLTVGTETNGSVICPSSLNGIVGFKPTVGLIPQTYIVPISSSQDTAGPMTKSVMDAAVMAGVMADNGNALNGLTPAQKASLGSLADISGNLAGKRIGVVRFAQGNNSGVIAAYNAALETLKQQGAELVEINDFNVPDAFGESSYYVLLAEFKTTLNAYLADSPAALPVRSLSDLIAYNEKDSRELTIFDQSIFLKAQETDGAQGQKYADAVALVQKHTREEGIDKLLADNHVDVLVAPSNNPAFLIDGIYGDHAPQGFIGIGYLAAIAGYPHATVPMATVKGMPVGLSVIGTRWDDKQVLDVAYGFEQSSQFKAVPGFYENSQAFPAVNAAYTPLKDAQ